MPRDKRSKRLSQRISEYKERPYKNTLAEQSFLYDPKAAGMAALVIRGGLDHEATPLRAFNAFGLDPTQPDHWRQLLIELTDVLFGERGKGPKRKWDFEPYAQLLSDFDEVSEKYQNLSGEKRFEVLTREQPYCTRYKDWTASTLRARHRDARNPRHNKLLAYIREDRREELLQRISKRWKSTPVC
jgi:hypothetical protein